MYSPALPTVSELADWERAIRPLPVASTVRPARDGEALRVRVRLIASVWVRETVSPEAGAVPRDQLEPRLQLPVPPIHVSVAARAGRAADAARTAAERARW